MTTEIVNTRSPRVVVTGDATVTPLVADSGTTYVLTKADGDQTVNLPAGLGGEWFRFIRAHAGDGYSTIINPDDGDTITTDDGTALAVGVSITNDADHASVLDLPCIAAGSWAASGGFA